jgi:hypothetical protein
MDGSANRDGVVMFQSGGIEYRAVVVRLARHSLVFEVYSPVVVLQKSESLTDFKLLVNERPVYAGKAHRQKCHPDAYDDGLRGGPRGRLARR